MTANSDRDDRLTVGIHKIAHMVTVNLRDGVMMCPSCGDELVEVSRDDEGINYECRTDKAVMDVIRRDLADAFEDRSTI